MKKTGILNPQLLEVMATVGHGDWIVVVDRGFPFPLSPEVKRVDLSIAKNLPRFMDVVSVLLEDVKVEKAFIAHETEKISPQIFDQLKQSLQGIEIEMIPHPQFKQTVLSAVRNGIELKAVVRTGEFTPYANVILQTGVVF